MRKTILAAFGLAFLGGGASAFFALTAIRLARVDIR
jgi:hypothetical protein